RRYRELRQALGLLSTSGKLSSHATISPPSISRAVGRATQTTSDLRCTRQSSIPPKGMNREPQCLSTLPIGSILGNVGAQLIDLGGRDAHRQPSKCADIL